MENNKEEKNDVEFKETDPLKTEFEIETEKTFSQKCCYVLRNITVEPSMLIFIMSCMIVIVTSQNLSLEKACRVNLNYTDEICTAMRMQELGTQSEYEKKAQELLTTYVARKTYITATLPCIIAMFAGSFQDKTGRRKMFQAIPLIGQFLLCLSNMVNVYFFHQLPLEVLMLTEALIEGFSGAWCLFFLSAFSYISAITTDEDRTFRMGLINFSLTVGFPIGMGLSGIILKKGGYYTAYGIPAALHFLNIIYNIFVLKDPERSKEHKKHDGRGFFYHLKTFCDLNHLRSTFGVVCRKTADNRTLRLTIILLVVCILFGPMFGEISVLYLSTRYRFNWDEVQFSVYQTYNFILHTIGTIFSIVVFSKILKWHDSILGFVSLLSKTAAAFVYCFAPTGNIFYIAPVVDILGGTSLLALRSIISKQVEPDELGKVNSIIGVCENIMPLVYVPLYTRLYRATMDVLPGAVFLLGAILAVPALCVFMWLYIRHRRILRKTKQEESNDHTMNQQEENNKPNDLVF